MLKARENDRRLSIIAMAVAIVVPLIIRFGLNADISITLLVLVAVGVGGLGIARRRYDADLPWLKYFSAAATAAVAVIVLVGIVITPLSAYLAWFDSFKAGIPEGGVSNIFVLIVSFYAAALSPMILSMGLLWPILTIALVLLYLLAVVLQASSALFFALLVLTAVAVFYSIRRSTVRENSRFRIGALVFTVAAILATLLSAGLFPRLEEPDGDEFVSSVAYPKLREAVVSTFPRFPLLYGVPGYGIQFDEKKLGGKPVLFDNPIFKVRGNPGELLYLRTRVFDTYNGTSWSMSKESSQFHVPAYRNPLFAIQRNRIDDLVEVKVTAKKFGYIPFTIDTEKIYFEQNVPEIRNGTRDIGFRLDGSLREGDVIYLERKQESQAGPALGNRSLFLQIPDDLPEELRAIADGLSANIDTRKGVLSNIEMFLAQQFTYDLDVPDVLRSEQQDFVYSFLFEQGSGYCVQFATSFIILARLNGVPARYATGYMAYIPRDSDEGDVTGLSSHAWPEVWLEDEGWVNWEATPAANLSNYTNLDEDWFFNFNIDLDRTTSRQIEGLLGMQLGSTSEDDQATDPENRGAGRILAIVAAGIGSVLLLAALTWLGIFRIRYALAADREKFFLKAGRFVRRARKRGVKEPQLQGWIAWSEALRKRVSADGQHVDEIRDLLVETAYSKNDFKRSDVEKLESLTKYISRNFDSPRRRIH